MFMKQPPSIVEGRPLSDQEFLTWLSGKERVLFQAATLDVQERSLAAGTQTTVALMGNVTGRAVRRLSAELVHRALFCRVC